MSTKLFPIKLSLEQILGLTKQLPKEVKIELMHKWLHEIQGGEEDSFSTNSMYLLFEKNQKKIHSTEDTSINLSIQDYDEPIDLDQAALTKEMLQPLENLWVDEIPAEELVNMLTK